MYKAVIKFHQLYLKCVFRFLKSKFYKARRMIGKGHGISAVSSFHSDLW